MENIKSGGNGLTVRTVVSGKTKTTYIIQNGQYILLMSKLGKRCYLMLFTWVFANLR